MTPWRLAWEPRRPRSSTPPRRSLPLDSVLIGLSCRALPWLRHFPQTDAPPAAAPARHRRRRYPWVLFAALITVVCTVGWLAVGILVHDGNAAVAPTRLEPLTFEFQAV